MPRRHLSLATSSAHGDDGTRALIWASRAERRTSIASIDPTPSARTDWATGSESSRPESHWRWPSVQLLPSKQELRHPVACPHQVAADVLAGTGEVAHRLLARRRHPDRVNSADHQKPHQALGVAAIGLDPVLGGALDLARCCDDAADPGSFQLASQGEAGGARLIADPDRGWHLLAETHHPLGLPSETLDSQLTGLGVGDRRDDLCCMNIEPYPHPNLSHGRHPIIAAAEAHYFGLTAKLMRGCQPN